MNSSEAEVEGNLEEPTESLWMRFLNGILDTLFSAAFFVEEHPLSSVLAAFAVGVVSALIARG